MLPSLIEVSSDLEQISSLLSHVVHIAERIGGFGDGPHLREQIQTDVRRLSALSQKVKNAMAQLSSNPGPTFESYQSRFEDLRIRMQKELTPVIERLRNSHTPTGESNGRPDTQVPLLSQVMIDQNTDLIDTLEQQVAGILQAMREVNSLFSQTMTELQRQSNRILQIEAETTQAVSEMSRGNDELDKADSHQHKSRRCICCIFILVILVVTAVGLIIAWQVFWKKDPEPTPAGTGRLLRFG
jgi:methyl-accepting chemotaxis protein